MIDDEDQRMSEIWEAEIDQEQEAVQAIKHYAHEMLPYAEWLWIQGDGEGSQVYAIISDIKSRFLAGLKQVKTMLP